MSAEKKFRIIQLVARGGTAILYKAIQTSLDRIVAVKKLHPHLTGDENFTRRFVLEAKAAASLDHENIVHVIDFGISDNSYHIIMEYVEGRSLREILERRKLIAPDLALVIAHQICRGLEHAHSKGIIHRDIKPGNVMITRYGRVKITDFGLAKLAQSSTHYTASNSILGTPLYMSPEQAFGESVDQRSDLFSLGTVLYEMLTGKQPFLSENYMGVIQNIINRHISPPSSSNREIPRELDNIVLKALHKNRENRFQSAHDFRKAIEKYLGIVRLKTAEEELRELLREESETIILSKKKTSHTTRKRKKTLVTFVGIAIAGVLTYGAVMQPEVFSRVLRSAHNGSLKGRISSGIPTNGSSISGSIAYGEAILPPFLADTILILAERPIHKEQGEPADSTPRIVNAQEEGDSFSAPTNTGVSDSEGTLLAAPSAASDTGRAGEDKREDDKIEKEKARPVRKGWLSVFARPWAEIYIDGRYTADTPPPESIELSAGPHTLECRNPQYEPYKEVLKITAGELSKRTIELRRLRGKLSLVTQEGAEFYIDGVLIGITPLKGPIEIDAGRHQLTLKKTGYNVWNSEISLEPNRVLPLKITLSPRF